MKTEEDPLPAPAAALSSFGTAEPPRWEDYSRCIHCGLCLNACPTFRVLGEEMDSPRGRIYQVAQADAGRLPLDAQMFLHLDQCLDCRACESACPSGVEYGKILERARGELEAHPELAGRGWLARRLRSYFFDRILPHPPALARQARWLRLYQRSGARALARASGLLRLLRLDNLESLAPEIDREFFAAEMGRGYPALDAAGRPLEGAPRARVALVAGCIQRVAFAAMNRATIRVLQRAGCEVTVPADQGCCGALHVHAGRRAQARELARRNLAMAERADAVISNSAGCGAVMKEYGDLFEVEGAPLAAARAFAAKVRDVTEFLDELGLPAGLLRPLPRTVTYQDPCHLAHGQKIRQAPRNLLAAVPGLRLIEMARADACCGSAGIYNVVHAKIASRLLAEKSEAAAETGAEWIVTANPGCLLQLRAGVRRSGSGQRVLHVIELLDEALAPAGA